MDIRGKVHLMFEQSGVFKQEFRKLGYDAFDYDIQNNFGQTDYVIDLFGEIESAYNGGGSLFDTITPKDLIIAFFPCIYFCDAKVMAFKGTHISMKRWSIDKIMDWNIDEEKSRHKFFIKLMQLVSVCCQNRFRLIIENPWNTSGQSYLQNNFPNPTIIDKNRAIRGDYFVKQTAYWFFNCNPTYGMSIQKNVHPKTIMKTRGKNNSIRGMCDEERSMISPDYARNFICDFIIGKEQVFSQMKLFD